MSKRRTHCPNGRKLYRSGELPDTLATETMLSRLRLRLSDGQEPVASLLYAGNKYAPLYEVAAAQELPALKGKAAIRYTAMRTCVRGGAVSPTVPLDADRDGRRLCDGCWEAEGRSRWQVRHNRDRAAAVEWARGVLADPTAVVVAMSRRSSWNAPFDVIALTPAGVEILREQIRPRSLADRTDLGGVPIGDVDDTGVLERLAAARLIGWHAGGLYELNVAWHNHRAAQHKWGTPQLTIGRDDAVDDHYTPWLGERRPEWTYRSAQVDYSNGMCVYAYQSRSDAEPHVLVAEIRKQLQRMADDDHPSGPPTCPVLTPTDLTVCHATELGPSGVCPAHEPVDQRETTASRG